LCVRNKEVLLYIDLKILSIKANAKNLIHAYDCRSMMLEYSGTKVIEGIESYVYTGGRHLLDNGDLYPDNKCFCSNKPREDPCALPTGVANVSLCRYGAPAFVSYPHFYLSDPSYMELIDMPNATDSDMFSLTLEPVSTWNLLCLFVTLQFIAEGFLQNNFMSVDSYAV
jgi:hypothetical protein